MRIAVCDDHRLFSEALAAVLETNGHTVVAAPTTPGDLLRIVAQQPIDVCFLDLSFPHARGVDAVAALVQGEHAPKVIVLTATEDPPVLAAAVAAGAHAVLRKDDPISAVIDALGRVSQGQTVMPGDVLEAALAGTLSGAAGDTRLNGFFLTDREREVLDCIVSGASTKQLAVHLGIRYSTARTHVQNVLTKLGVHSKLEAVAVAVSRGLLPQAAG